MNGNHRPEGVLFLSIPTSVGAAHIEDVGPTVLAVLGTPCPEMDGVSLIDAPVHGDAPFDSVPETYSHEQARTVEERLRALGYFE